MTTALPAQGDPFEGIILDRSSPMPLYFQVAQHLESEIRTGRLATGSRLDNELRIAEALGVSRPTVRAALRCLVDKGLLVRRPGYGTVVTKEKVDRTVELTSLYDDLVEAAKAPTTKVLRNEVIEASEAVAVALEIPVGELVVFLERLRFVDGEPIALMHNFLPGALVTLSNDMLEKHGLYELLRASGIRPTWATQRMSAKNATSAEASYLQEARRAALLTMERVTFDQGGRAIEYAQHVYRASRYAIHTTLAAPRPPVGSHRAPLHRRPSEVMIPAP
jgi:DNA-binding GntR family transcriptional regulator